MEIRRIRRRKSQSFTTINNSILRDKNLSLKAKAIMVTVMGLPDSWDFSVAGLIQLVKEGRDCVYAAIRELEDHGYVARQSVRDKGRMVGWEYVFSEEPMIADEPHTGFPYTEKPDTEKPDTENPTQYKKDLIKDLKNKETVHIEGNGQVWDFPMKELIEAFPDYLPDRITPAMIGFIEADVLPSDAEAWRQTIETYKMNFNPMTRSYLPDKTANLLGVFRKKKSELERERHGASQPKYRISEREKSAQRGANAIALIDELRRQGELERQAISGGSDGDRSPHSLALKPAEPYRN